LWGESLNSGRGRGRNLFRVTRFNLDLRKENCGGVFREEVCFFGFSII